MDAHENKIELEARSFKIFGGIMIFLIGVAIALIQWSISDNADRRIAEQITLAKREAKAEAKSGEILKAVNNSEVKVDNLTTEVHGYRNDVVKSYEARDKSLNKYNEIKKQDEKIYIPNATIEQQTDFISKYKYEQIGAN